MNKPNDTKPRCAWAGEHPPMLRYHDEEWGVPCPRRPPAVRVPHPGRRASRPHLAHDPGPTPELPPGVRTLQRPQDRQIWIQGCEAAAFRRGHHPQPAEDRCRHPERADSSWRFSRNSAPLTNTSGNSLAASPIDNKIRSIRQIPRHDAAIRQHEQRPEDTRLQVRRPHHLLCLHAGRRHGQ